MKLLDRGFSPQEVFTHPRHQATQKALVQLIEQLRACEGPRDGFELQQELLAHVRAADEERNKFAWAVKLMERRRPPQPGAPEPESGQDPSRIETWIFERELWERIGRQYRSVGDALAWRAFDFQRRLILALCRNDRPGSMAGKAGTAAEVREVERLWHEEGVFALMHDLTNCLRIGDVTVFGDGVPDTREIKTNPKKRNAAQLRRIKAAREALWNAAVLPGDDPREKLYDLAMPFKTHLDLLRVATETAATEGIAATQVPGSRALVVADLYGSVNQGWSDEQFAAQLDAEFNGALRRAGIARREVNIHATSMDSVALDPLRVPWGVYPLHPVACARLIGDIAVFTVETSGPALAQQLQASGIRAQWVRPPGLGGELAEGEVVMKMYDVTRIPLGTGVLENQRTLEMRRSELDRYLIELIDPVIWTAGIRHLLESPQTSGRPWPHYRDEHLEWW